MLQQLGLSLHISPPGRSSFLADGRHRLPGAKSFEGAKQMWAWQKKEVQERSWQGAARAVLAGASRDELIREAIHAISKDGRTDRIGVWLEQEVPYEPDTLVAACLRGIVWEAGEDG